jgi:hypothetical protein
MHVALLELHNALEAMRVAGEFDRPSFACTGHDLSGDGVEEVIEVAPPVRLEIPGSIRIVDGATGAERHLLRAPNGEMGFGEHLAVVTDADGDGLPDIAVFSWREAEREQLEMPMQLLVRIFSGSTAELVGVLHTVWDLDTPLDALVFDVGVGGDANLDGVLDTGDIVAASAALSSPAALAPTVDCRVDGAFSMQDVTAVVERVLDKPQFQRAMLYSVLLRNIEIIEPIMPPGSGLDPEHWGGGEEGSGGGGGGVVPPPCIPVWQGGWNCWIAAGAVTARTLYVIAKLLACASGPQLAACALPLLCSLLTLLGVWMEFYNRCFQTPACVSPLWTTLNMLLGLVGLVCEGGLFTSQNWEKIKDGLRKLRGLQPTNSVAVG